MSSDDELKSNAHEYFPRHMKILERCSGFWQMSDIQQQITSLRMAFAANSNKALSHEPLFDETSPPLNTCALSQRNLEHLPSNNLVTPHQSLEITNSFSENQPSVWPIQAGITDSQNDISYLKQNLLENQVTSDSQSVDEFSLPNCIASIPFDFKQGSPI